MRMDEGMDSGDILHIFEIDNDFNITAFELSKMLSQKGASLLLETLKNYKNIKPIKQDATKATFCKKIKKEDGLIDFENESSNEIELKYRAYNPWPGIFTNSKIKLFGITQNTQNAQKDVNKAGEILQIDRKSGVITIACKIGAINIKEIQAPNKAKTKASDFLNGRGLKIGDIFA